MTNARTHCVWGSSWYACASKIF